MGVFGAQQQASLWSGARLLSHIVTASHETIQHEQHIEQLTTNHHTACPVSPSPSSPDKALLSMQEELQQELAAIRQERQKLLAAVTQRCVFTPRQPLLSRTL